MKAHNRFILALLRRGENFTSGKTGRVLRVEIHQGLASFVVYDRHGNGTRLPYAVNEAGLQEALDHVRVTA